MENFVRDYGTGNAIPETPLFVNYANTDAPPVSLTRVATRPSNFTRSTQRANRSSSLPQDDEPFDDTNRAGVGAGGSGVPSRDAAPLSRSATQKSTTSPRSQANGVNGHVSPSREPQRRHSVAPASVKQPLSAGDPVDPMVSNTQLVIGDRTWDVDPNKDPQQQKASQARTSPPVGEQDPLVKQMAELNTAAAASSIGRRNTIRRDGPPSSVESRKGANDSLSTPSTTTSAGAAPRDFRNSAEVVVGSYPLAQTPSRSASPNPPKAALVSPPPPSIPPSASNMPVEQVVSGYQRPFPGEARSRANSYVGPSPPIVNQNHDHGVSRPTSRGGYPGVGSQSLVARPPSPARGPSPTAMQPYNRGPPAPSAPPGGGLLRRGASVSRRPVTPTNPVGIALGPDGRVVHDMMVARQPSAHYPQPGPPAQPTQPPQPYPGYHDTSRALTHPQQQQPPPPRNDYAVAAPNAYGGAQPYNNYGHPPPPQQQHPSYNDGYHGQQSYGQAAPPPQSNYNNNYGAVTRPGYHQQNQSVGHVAANATQQRYPGNAAMYRSTSPGMGRSPSPAAPRGQPAPTGAYTDDGRPILFYGAYSWSRCVLGARADYRSWSLQSRRSTTILQRSTKSLISKQGISLR